LRALRRLRRETKESPAAALTHIDELLDEALKATFPASDPVAINSEAINIERGAVEREIFNSSREERWR
jgi:hypothetical protein